MSSTSSTDNKVYETNSEELGLEKISSTSQNQCTRYFLTYVGHLNKDMCRKFLNEKCKARTGKDCCKRIEIAWETGQKTVNYHHTHIFVNFGARYTIGKKNMNDFDMILLDGLVVQLSEGKTWNGHPHIKTVKTSLHEQNIFRYLAKEDPDNIGLLEQLRNQGKNSGSSVDGEGVLSCGTLKEALSGHATRYTDVSGITAIHRLGGTKMKEMKLTMSWHKYMRNIIEGKPDPRKVYWIIDILGGEGKTMLAKWAVGKELAYVSVGTQGAKDFSTIVEHAIDSGWNGRTWIFDIPRNEKIVGIYPCIEMIKSGMITTSKYSGRTSVFNGKNGSNVMVMSNSLPDLKALSMDRWQIYLVLDGGLFKIQHKVTLEYLGALIRKCEGMIGLDRTSLCKAFMNGRYDYKMICKPEGIKEIEEMNEEEIINELAGEDE